MKRTLFLPGILLLAVLVPALAQAQTEGAVWYTPASAKEGEKIELRAFVHNDTDEAVTAAIVFRAGTGTLATTEANIQPRDGAIATVQTTLPKYGTLILAEVERALTPARVEVPALAGPIASTVAGDRQVAPATAARGILAEVLAITEPFRLKHAAYFDKLKAEKRAYIGIGEKPRDFLERIPETPAPTPENTPQSSVNYYAPHGGLDFGAYGALIYASVGSALFSNRYVFYGVAILLALLILRYLFRLFF